MYQTYDQIEKPEAKFAKGDRVYHLGRREWVTITSEATISEKRWHDYGIVELDYSAKNDDGQECWGYEGDFRS
jgi:hypothetical protein